MRLTASLVMAVVVFALFACGPRRDTSGDIHGTPYMNIEVANKGTIRIELYPKEAPKNVRSVVRLTRHKFYDGSVFHRVEPGSLIQGGSRGADPRGTAGYFIADEISPNLKHVRGTMGMANGGPNTNSCQFYICLKDIPELDGTYTIVGKVVDGMSVADQVAVDDVMTRVWIEEKK